MNVHQKVWKMSRVLAVISEKWGFNHKWCPWTRTRLGKKQKGTGEGNSNYPRNEAAKKKKCRREGRPRLGEGHCRERAGTLPPGEEKPGGYK